MHVTHPCFHAACMSISSKQKKKKKKKGKRKVNWTVSLAYTKVCMYAVMLTTYMVIQSSWKVTHACMAYWQHGLKQTQWYIPN